MIRQTVTALVLVVATLTLVACERDKPIEVTAEPSSAPAPASPSAAPTAAAAPSQRDAGVDMAKQAQPAASPESPAKPKQPWPAPRRISEGKIPPGEELPVRK